jgi:hypothetical protein
MYFIMLKGACTSQWRKTSSRFSITKTAFTNRELRGCKENLTVTKRDVAQELEKTGEIHSEISEAELIDGSGSYLPKETVHFLKAHM